MRALFAFNNFILQTKRSLPMSLRRKPIASRFEKRFSPVFWVCLMGVPDKISPAEDDLLQLTYSWDKVKRTPLIRLLKCLKDVGQKLKLSKPFVFMLVCSTQTSLNQKISTKIHLVMRHMGYQLLPFEF